VSRQRGSLRAARSHCATVVEAGRNSGGEDQDADHLHHRRDPVDGVVAVVGRGEPGEVHPRPPDGEEDHGEADDRGERMAASQAVVELDAGLSDRHHEAQIEEELERRRDPVMLVRIARGHRHGQRW
jgi:hypothetical protein